jgi:hypothetical protein
VTRPARPPTMKRKRKRLGILDLVRSGEVLAAQVGANMTRPRFGR